MSNIVKLRGDSSPTGNSASVALDVSEEAKIRALELFAAIKEEVGRVVFSIDLMLQHSRLIIARVSDADVRKTFEKDLSAVEKALEVAHKALRSI